MQDRFLRPQGGWEIQVAVPDDAPAHELMHLTVSYRGREWNSIDITAE